jgi:hypothetical protein
VHDAGDPQIQERLKDLHPVSPPPDLSDLKLDEAPRLPWDTSPEGEEERLRALLSLVTHFPPGSAGGPSGLKPAHLKECLQDADSGVATDFLRGLDSFVRLCLDGELLPGAVPYLCSGKLIPLRKGSGMDVRPIAVGETLRRIVSKALMSHPLARRAAQSLEPLQLGLGTRGACELVAHGTQALTSAMHSQEPDGDWGVLQVDLKNAFNTLLRLAILAGVRGRFPEGSHWMATCYGQASFLFADGMVLLSTTGVQQGDNAAPAAFCFGTHDMVEALEGIDGLLWQAWYMDDGTLVGRLSALEEALQKITRLGAERGLQVNLGKCVLWTPASAVTVASYAALSGVHRPPYAPTEGIRVLGAPVVHPEGDGAFSRRPFEKSTAQMHEMCRVLTHLPAAHVQYTLLRYCLDGCRLAFLLRSTPATHIAQEVGSAGRLLRTTLGDVLGSQLTDSQWAQAVLPQRLGGLGIKSPADMCIPARLASCADFLQRGREVLGLPPDLPLLPADLPYVLSEATRHLGPRLEPLAGWVANPGAISQGDSTHTKQHWWGDRWHEMGAGRLLESLSAREKARFAFQRDQKGGPWLGVAPCKALGTEIPSDEFRLLARYWIGAPLLETQGILACPKCGTPCDTLGDHLVSCPRNDLRRRHETIQGALFELAQLAGVQAALEVALPDGSVPGDLCFRQWDADGPAMIDVTCRCPVRLGAAPPPPDGISAWFRAQEDDKDASYLMKCRAKGCSFIPFVLTPWGGMGPEAKRLAFRLLKLALGHKQGWARTRTAERFWQKLSLAVVRPVGRQLAAAQQAQEHAWAPGGAYTHNPYR